MKYCFFFPNKKISSIDFSTIKDGNPGIGGTEFAIYAICNELAKDNDVYLLSQVPVCGCSVNITNCIASENFIDNINEIIPDVFIVHHSPYVWNKGSLDAVNTQTKIVVWVHNFLYTRHLNRYANDVRINKVVFVGHEMYDRYRDHSIIYKSSYIFNPLMISDDDYKKTISHPYVERENIVTYVGNIIPDKGFHFLARAWKTVIKYKPDAQLYVIGSGKLYNETEVLGPWGIAAKKYESKFIKYLVDENGCLLKNVHFLGILGKEKDDIFLKTKVGVPNPSGKSETFGYTAVEMSKLGVLITTKSVEGYLDTVPKSAGVLYKNINDLAMNIVRLLNQSNIHYIDTFHYIMDNFSTPNVANRWRLLLMDLIKGKETDILPYTSKGKYKKIKELNRKLKTISFLRFLPSIDSIFQFFSFKNVKTVYLRLR